MGSFGEIVLILLVAIIFMKTEDIKEVGRLTLKIRAYINSLMMEIQEHITTDENQNSKTIMENIDEINFYLSKISELQMNYQGEYDLDSIKKFYYTNISKLSQTIQNNSIEKDLS